MEIQAASQKEQAFLGMGYDLFKEEFVGTCVGGDIVYSGQQQSSVQIDRSMSEQEVASSLGFDLNARVRYGLYSGSLAANFASSTASSEYSDVTTYSSSITFKNAILQFSDLTDVGRTAKGGDGAFISTNWPLACGHEFVSQITLGAKLFVSVKIEFGTRKEKERFAASVGIQGPLVDVKASLELAKESFGKRASVTVSGFQLGGDVRKLNSIFGTDGTGTPPVLTASLAKPEAILQLLERIVKYAAEDFPNQVNPDLPPNTPSGPANLSYLTSPYEEIGLFPQPLIIKEGVQIARETLGANFEVNAKHQRRLNSLLDGPIRLSRRQQQRMQEIQFAVSSNLNLIQEAVIVCYTDELKASEKVGEVVAQLKGFVPEDFEIQPESFAQWYDMKDLPGTLVLVKDKEVIEALVDKFKGDFNNFAGIEDKGAAIQGRIEAKLEEISNLSIGETFQELLDYSLWSIISDSRIVNAEIIESMKEKVKLINSTALTIAEILTTNSNDLIGKVLREKLTFQPPIVQSQVVEILRTWDSLLQPTLEAIVKSCRETNTSILDDLINSVNGSFLTFSELGIYTYKPSLYIDLLQDIETNAGLSGEATEIANNLFDYVIQRINGGS